MLTANSEYEGLTTGRTNLMCFPLSFSAICCSSGEGSSATFTFSKVILTAEETRNYQLPWESQQKKLKSKRRSLCLCWCCLCSCKPVSNRKNRRVSISKIERKKESYKNIIELIRPSIDQIHKWSTSFEDVMTDKTGMMLFDVFLQQEHSDENLKFWLEVNKLKGLEDTNEKRDKMKNIYNEYLKPMSSKEVNISGTARRKIEEELLNEPSDVVFDIAQKQVFLMMLRQSYPRFLSSDLFHSVVQKTYAYGVNAPAEE